MDPYYMTKMLILKRLWKSSLKKGDRNSLETRIRFYRLTQLMCRNGDPVSSLALETQHLIISKDNPGSADVLNLADEWRDFGHPIEAELLLRQAVEIESRLLPQDWDKHAHQLNSLATVLIMQGKLIEAKKCLCRAMNLLKDKYDATTLRILVNRIAVWLMEARIPQTYIGQLKTLFYARRESAGNAIPVSRAAVMVDAIACQLTVEHAEFLRVLFRVLNNPGRMPELERFAIWTDTPAIPLEPVRLPLGNACEGHD